MKTIQMYADEVEYYEALMDYLYDTIPCIDEMVSEFNKQWQEGEE